MSKRESLGVRTLTHGTFTAQNMAIEAQLEIKNAIIKAQQGHTKTPSAQVLKKLNDIVPIDSSVAAENAEKKKPN